MGVSMENIIDYLAEEEQKRLKAAARVQAKVKTQSRKSGKHERIGKMLKNLTPEQPVVVDFLAMGD
jgi:hypothetical protein